MRQLPLYLRLQQLIDGELPEQNFREVSDLERVFQELDEADRQKDELPEEELELDELEGDLLAADLDDGTDLGALIERKTSLEAELFGAGGGRGDASDEIRPLRELVETLSEASGTPKWAGRPRLERLLKAVENLSGGSSDERQGLGLRRRRWAGGRNLVAARRRKLLAEFRAAWLEALDHRPNLGSEGPDSSAPSAGTDEREEPKAPAAQPKGKKPRRER